MLVRESDGVYRSGRLLELPWLIHGFGTRHSPQWPGEYAQVKQIHSDIIHRADRTEFAGQGDALVTSIPGVVIGVRTADCVPILLVDPVHRAVAAVHAGWRGTVQNIAGKSVARLAAEFGTAPGSVLAVIGPCIGQCCYEVGPEVGVQFRDSVSPSETPRYVDLALANRRQLMAAGLPDEGIETSGLCTRCNSELESYRRDRDASGRMVAAIGLRNEAKPKT